MRFRKPILGALVGFILFSLVAMVGTDVYYRFMPATWFVDYYYIKVDDSELGKDVQFTSCRKLRGDKITLDANRTFLLKGDNNNQFFPIGDYDFDASLEKLRDTNCQPLRITPERHPQDPGTYKILTEGEFMVNGHRKVIRYESNEYKITPNAESIQDKILELQMQIDELKRQQEAFIMTSGITGTVARTTTPAVQATPNTPVVTAQSRPVAVTQAQPQQRVVPTNRPQEQVQPQPNTPNTPSVPDSIGNLLQSTVNNVRGIIGL